MDIGFYIADLLRNQDEVSLPGLGTFTKIRMAGSYDKASNCFMPPSYQVSFTNTENNYHSLTEYISSKKNLSESSSEYFVKKFTSALYELLQTSGIAEIKPLGIIRQKDKNLTFEASTNFEFSGNFYGLKPVKDIAVAIPNTYIPVPAPPVEEVQKPVITEEELQLEESEIEEEELNNNGVKIRIIAGIILLIASAVLLYLFYPPLKTMFNGNKAAANINKAAANAPSENKSVPAVSDSALAVQAKDSALKEVTAESLVVRSPLEAPVNTAISYEIIGAAFARKTEADEYIKQLAAKGLTGKIVDNLPGKRIKISLGTFTDEQSAQAELIKVQKEINKDAWIARIKPTKTR